MLFSVERFVYRHGCFFGRETEEQVDTQFGASTRRPASGCQRLCRRRYRRWDSWKRAVLPSPSGDPIFGFVYFGRFNLSHLISRQIWHENALSCSGQDLFC